ncbi:MAG: DUF2249 domain-containing protein [Alphaproteobacteria bacterium]|nr:DUF2249 domain-containing protein [Alphaproteobacteria bacterium]
MNPNDTPPSWLNTADVVATVDACALLANGLDPLGAVIDAAMAVPDDAVLAVEAPFDPMPMRHVLRGMGFSSFSQALGEGRWRVSFRRDGGQSELPAMARDNCPMAEVGAPVWRTAGEVHIDVRGLAAPQPMVSILRLLVVLPPGLPVIVHHEREPLYLYPELAERGWNWAALSGEPGEVRLRLTRTVS